MKVLKSGIEMTPEELSKAKAGACACGCGWGYNGENLVSSAQSGKCCGCGCTEPKPPGFDSYEGNESDAFSMIFPEV
ncbi:MAG: hypothetical protein GTO45_16385 [Candidatus Aminicenantes bacterium]|nr:hypothetical protein [Candidatus Aminicenantes bacterium]NIM78279.1 hypothetical protein [Candidatus Aminicenantes bacterium]NIN19705.1 hypothetical protein [Candidatus Aminicenantes bacterium]NIN43587.1 hypothetical protein [Candidatus Aminicenantes bacterium]NIN86332.1 hypothetical protein [Candidatus Aminicenantes bacterium]